MSLVSKLYDEKVTLIVSLPKNDIKLALAAISAGADAIKLHLNIVHRASKVRFGTYEEELHNIEEILNLAKKCSVEIGIVTGATCRETIRNIDNIISKGFDFVSLYDKYMEVEILKKRISKMVAIDDTYNLDLVRIISSLPIEALECSVVKPAEYGSPLTVRDLMIYRSLRAATDTAIVIPSQKRIKPEHVEIMKEIGINGLMVGAISVGNTKESIYESVLAFKKEINRSYMK